MPIEYIPVEVPNLSPSLSMSDMGRIAHVIAQYRITPEHASYLTQVLCRVADPAVRQQDANGATFYAMLKPTASIPLKTANKRLHNEAVRQRMPEVTPEFQAFSVLCENADQRRVLVDTAKYQARKRGQTVRTRLLGERLYLYLGGTVEQAERAIRILAEQDLGTAT